MFSEEWMEESGNTLSDGHWYDAELVNSVSCGAPRSSEGCYWRTQVSSKDVKMVAAPLNTQDWLPEISLLFQEDDKGEMIKPFFLGWRMPLEI